MRLIDRPIGVCRRGKTPLPLRPVAVRKSPQAAEAARKARCEAQKGGHQILPAPPATADRLIPVASLPPKAFAAADFLAFCRLRWCIELAFKRLKSLVGLKRLPGTDARSARPYVPAPC